MKMILRALCFAVLFVAGCEISENVQEKSMLQICNAFNEALTVAIDMRDKALLSPEQHEGVSLAVELIGPSCTSDEPVPLDLAAVNALATLITMRQEWTP